MNVNTFRRLKSLVKDNCLNCDGKKCTSCIFGKYEKPYFFFFLHHPWLNGKLPELPNFDIFGNPKENYKAKVWKWNIHHINANHYDDRENNTCIFLFHEHGYIHCTQYMSDILKEQGRNGTHYSQTKEFKEMMGEVQSLLIQNGDHAFVDPKMYEKRESGREERRRLGTDFSQTKEYSEKISQRHKRQLADGTHFSLRPEYRELQSKIMKEKSTFVTNNPAKNKNGKQHARRRKIMNFLQRVREEIQVDDLKPFMGKFGYTTWAGFRDCVNAVIRDEAFKTKFCIIKVDPNNQRSKVIAIKFLPV